MIHPICRSKTKYHKITFNIFEADKLITTTYIIINTFESIIINRFGEYIWPVYYDLIHYLTRLLAG